MASARQSVRWTWQHVHLVVPQSDLLDRSMFVLHLSGATIYTATLPMAFGMSRTRAIASRSVLAIERVTERWGMVHCSDTMTTTSATREANRMSCSRTCFNQATCGGLGTSAWLHGALRGAWRALASIMSLNRTISFCSARTNMTIAFSFSFLHFFYDITSCDNRNWCDCAFRQIANRYPTLASKEVRRFALTLHLPQRCLNDTTRSRGDFERYNFIQRRITFDFTAETTA